MSATARLQLPFLVSGQAQKHVTVNESLLRLDALVQISVESASLGAEPGAPVDGDLYILPAGKTGADWGAMADGALAYWRDGIWEELAPGEGWLAYVKDTGRVLARSASAWAPLAGAAGLGASDAVEFGRVGVGGAASAGVAFHAQGAATQELRLHHTGGSGPFRILNASTTCQLNHEPASGQALIDFNPLPQDGSSAAIFRFFRGSNTSGACQLEVYYGNNTATRAHMLSGKSYSLIDQQGQKVKVGANAAPACALDVEGPVRVKAYAVTSLPSASAGAGQIIYVSDESGGAVLAFSDGAAWRRVTDRAVVS